MRLKHFACVLGLLCGVFASAQAGTDEFKDGDDNSTVAPAIAAGMNDSAGSGNTGPGPSKSGGTGGDWHVSVSPYLWLPGIHGIVGAFGRNADLSVGPIDLLSHFRFGLLGTANARWKWLDLPIDAIWIRLGSDKALPPVGVGATSVDLKADGKKSLGRAERQARRTNWHSMQQWFALAALALKVSIPMQVFAIGLGAAWEDAVYLFRRPVLLANSILARNVAVPIIAILLIKTFSFHVAVAITLGVLAVTPVPPLLPKSQINAGADSGYVLGLVVSQASLAMVLVPLTIELMNWALGVRAHFAVAPLAALIGEAILVPLGLGMLASKFLPRLYSLAPHLLMVGTLLVIVGAIPLLIVGWQAFSTLTGKGAMLAMAIFVIAGTAGGHFLGGPRAEDRTTLAIATSSRHPGLALAIAHANFPDQARLVAGAIVIYLILRMVLLYPYLHWLRSPRNES